MLRKLFGRKQRPQRPTSPPTDSIRDVRLGDVLVIQGLSPEYADAFFFIEQMHRYEGPAGTSYEIVAADGDNKVWVEWSDEDGLFVTMSYNRRAWSLSSLGLTEDELIQLDEDHSFDNYITLEDQRYYYRHSFEAGYFKDNRGAGEDFYVWDFMAEDESRVLAISKWEGLPFEGHFSEVISPHSVTLYPGERPQDLR
jgi:hypothetical protein